ncbi:MBL fold metallo-hydrolase [Variovorax sp. PCZ-1]|uniref:MBL fold metallo-hydrolase n=1 Tax=Variovorax sp. PCZ-1 TaxID=2835533 RepID=UPI001BCFDE75|nr:MBL fold metallo-hydrolase [Variovorax sp. PCZ-1]MBS7808772.1 MBL fold metallo-hydrolase [Variovorax sp. PCZ-1]
MKFIVICGLLGLSACASVNEDYNPAKKHHRPEGFQNNYIDVIDKSRLDLLRWKWQSTLAGLPKPPEKPTPTVSPDIKFVAANRGAAQEPAITWIGHATMLVQMGGLNILTDPHFSERASPVQFAGPKRAQPPGMALKDLPHIDLVLLSHNHYDHLDAGSVKALNAQAGGAPLFIVPLGVKKWFAAEGITNVQQLDWWDQTTLKTAAGQVEVHFTPVQHWSARGPGDRRRSLWGGFAVFASDFQMYFSGDTGYSQDFNDTQKHFAARQTPALGGSFDIALIAVGAYAPRWFMKDQHIDPTDAVQIHLDLQAKRSVGVHWGTFTMTDESLDQPPKDLALARTVKQLPQESFDVMAIGQTIKLPRRRVAQ